jgi:quinone-modifying oxidoreductase subunit QmoA
VKVFYIDIRSPGTLEDFYCKVQGYKDVTLIKGKVAKIEEDPQTGDLIVEADDILAGKKAKERVEMVVLATGIVPTLAGNSSLARVSYDSYGFVAGGPPGVYAAGCAKRPGDVASSVQDATGAALKAIQSIVRRGANG